MIIRMMMMLMMNVNPAELRGRFCCFHRPFVAPVREGRAVVEPGKRRTGSSGQTGLPFGLLRSRARFTTFRTPGRSHFRPGVLIQQGSFRQGL